MTATATAHLKGRSLRKAEGQATAVSAAYAVRGVTGVTIRTRKTLFSATADVTVYGTDNETVLLAVEAIAKAGQ